MLGNGCPVGTEIAKEGNQLEILLAGPGMGEDRMLEGLVGGGRVGILFPWTFVGE